jgi:hypothetical protein
MTDKDDTTTNESFMRQKLMSAEECYVYKIPPLKDSGGHRYVKKPRTTIDLSFLWMHIFTYVMRGSVLTKKDLILNIL